MVPLIYLHSNTTGQQYINILSDHLHPFMSRVHLYGQFQQDDASPHWSTITTEWLEKHSYEFCTLSWSPDSPDINIIEHI
ncbi:transposable element tcb2 transposase [Trichonephila clavipes]|nr:transposable element tcb2 transposase [Trichonephila clavipes]